MSTSGPCRRCGGSTSTSPRAKRSPSWGETARARRPRCGRSPVWSHRGRAGIRFDGSDVVDLPAERRVALGVALVPEARGLFPRLTVGENLAMGAYHRREWGRRLAPDFDLVCAVFPRLGERFGQPASTLSGGEQQMLAVGRAMIGRPRLLLVDEPSLGLAPVAVEQLYRTFDDLKADGLTLVVVEQHVEVALGFADRVYVLDKGQVALSGQGADLAVSMVGVYLSAVSEEGVHP